MDPLRVQSSATEAARRAPFMNIDSQLSEHTSLVMVVMMLLMMIAQMVTMMGVKVPHSYIYKLLIVRLSGCY